MTKKLQRCSYCGNRFEVIQRGRPRLYCSRSHRERAYEKRKSAEFRQPSLKQFRLLNERLGTLARQRAKSAHIHEFVAEMTGRDPNSTPRPPAYERSVRSVRVLLSSLAPEVLGVQQHGLPPGRVELARSSKVFRRLAAQHHPDHSGNVEVMKAINELWQAVKVDVGQARPGTSD
jgi:hypothetical protein